MPGTLTAGAEAGLAHARRERWTVPVLTIGLHETRDDFSQSSLAESVRAELELR